MNITITESQLRNLKKLYEVRYVNTKYPQINLEEPLDDNGTIRVYHGTYRFEDAEKILTTGLSGKERAARIYSYESGNNPKGLFVTVDFPTAKKFTHSGVIIEFSTKISDLEAPVWVDGRSYFVQGEFTKSFKDADEREQQRLVNRERDKSHDLPAIANSNRAELANTIFDNPERQALYIGDLNPNMIKYVWYNEVLHKERRTNGEWVKLSRKEFINKLKVNTKRERYLKYLPNDDFNFEEFVNKYFKGDYTNTVLKMFFEFDTKNEYDLKSLGFFPKQINQIMTMRKNGDFDKYFN